MPLELTYEEKSIIDKVLIQTQELDTLDLTNLTNINNGPWQRFYNEQDSEHNQIIPKDEIYNFYLNKNVLIQSQEETGLALVKKIIPLRN